MLEVELVRAPAVGEHVQHELDDLRGGALYEGTPASLMTMCSYAVACVITSRLYIQVFFAARRLGLPATPYIFKLEAQAFPQAPYRNSHDESQALR